MKNEKSHKIIVAGGMAAAIAVGAVTFALRPHAPITVTQSLAPPPPLAQAADAPARTAATPDLPAPAVQEPVITAASAEAPVLQPKEPSKARTGHAARADMGASHGDATSLTSSATADTNARPEAAAVASNSASPGAASSAAAASVEPAPDQAVASSEQPVAASADAATLDSRITTDVKSALAADAGLRDLNIGVTTNQGVVALTGTMASQDAIDHVKGIAGKVKEVRSVDTTALLVAQL